MKNQIFLSAFLLSTVYCTLSTCIFLPTVSSAQDAFNQPVTFTQADRDRLIRMEVTLEQFMRATDKRFEELRSDMNQRFDQVFTFLWILTGIFVAITGTTIGFAFWDRRTMIRPFETKVKEIEAVLEEIRKEGSLNKVIAALREVAKTDSKVAQVLRTYNLL